MTNGGIDVFHLTVCMLPLYTSARLFQVNLCCFDREWSACRWRMKRQIQFATVFKNIVKKCNNSHQAAAISWVGCCSDGGFVCDDVWGEAHRNMTGSHCAAEIKRKRFCQVKTVKSLFTTIGTFCTLMLFSWQLNLQFSLQNGEVLIVMKIRLIIGFVFKQIMVSSLCCEM